MTVRSRRKDSAGGHERIFSIARSYGATVALRGRVRCDRHSPPGTDRHADHRTVFSRGYELRSGRSAMGVARSRTSVVGGTRQHRCGIRVDGPRCRPGDRVECAENQRTCQRETKDVAASSIVSPRRSICFSVSDPAGTPHVRSAVPRRWWWWWRQCAVVDPPRASRHRPACRDAVFRASRPHR